MIFDALLAIALSITAAAQDLAPVDEHVRAEMARQQIPGLAVAVVRNGEVLRLQGYGLANVEHQVPVTPDTIFQSGSIGKQFTAAAIMLLVEDGKLDLADPLSRFFPDAPAHWSGITVRHLLTHTSGLPDYTDGTLDYRRDYSEDELVRFAYALEPEFAPGARYNYSNTGYVLLGIVIRKASGQFYGDFLRERVFAPLGMKTARIITEEDIVPNRAAGYRLAGGELKNQEWVAPQLNTTADGSLYLSLRDLVAWDVGLRSRATLKEESWRVVFTPVSLNSGNPYPYGLGWAVDRVGTRPVHRHGGSWQGFKADIARYPEDDLTIIVLANLAQADPAEISDGIAAILDPRLARPELAPIEDHEPAIQESVRRILADTAAGRLNPADFAYMRAGSFAEGTKRVAALLKEAGTIRRLVLLDARDLGDDRVYTYDVHADHATLRLRIGFAPDRTVSSYSLSRRP